MTLICLTVNWNDECARSATNLPVNGCVATVISVPFRLETEADLHAMAEHRAPTARYDSGAYRVARAHLVGLLTDAGSKPDVGYRADVLLAMVGAGLFIHQRRERHFDLDQIKAGLDEVLVGLSPDAGEL